MGDNTLAAYSGTKTSTNTSDKKAGGDYSLREGMQDIRKDAATVKDDLGTLKSDATQMAAHTTQEAIEAVRQGAQSASEMARSVSESAKDLHGSFCDKVSQRPTASILLAVGAGVVVGRILARR